MEETQFLAVLIPETLSVVQAFELFTRSLKATLPHSDALANDLKSAGVKVRKRGVSLLPLSVADFEFDYAQVLHKRLDWLSIRAATLPGEFCQIMIRELHQTGTLVMAVVLNRHYDYWQNAEDPLQFKAAGRSMQGLPMKSNGLPPPLAQDVVDISHNPGRRIIRNGFIEVPSYLTWTTDHFWKLGCSRRELLGAVPGIVINDDAPGLMRIQVGSKCFSSAECEEARLQDMLRESLFGNRESSDAS